MPEGTQEAHRFPRCPMGLISRRAARNVQETRISPRPPRRSRRALLTHRALPLGSGVEAMQRFRMQNLDWRKESAGEPEEFLLAEERLLASPPERT